MLLKEFLFEMPNAYIFVCCIHLLLYIYINLYQQSSSGIHSWFCFLLASQRDEISYGLLEQWPAISNRLISLLY